MKSERQPAESRRAPAGKVLIFAPSDADSEYLDLQRELSRLREEDGLENAEILRVFETTEVPKSGAVVDPETATELRERYSVAPGTLTLLMLSAHDQTPVSRISGGISRLDLREAVAALAGGAR
ncbi:MAG TPA: hypothetical protein VMT85_12255 [Thermoanaerobaculia bacterium]|nr:hypothetical protein [Thermoanaerobaculia bacterium]